MTMTTATTTMNLVVPPNGTGLVDTAPGIVAPRVAEDDPIATTEEAIRAMTLAHADEELKLAMSLLAHGPAAASRALHLVEGMANIHAQVLVLLGIHRKKGRLRRAGAVSINGYTSLGAPAYDTNFDEESDPETYTGNAQAETFGNKALQQLIEMFKPLMQEGGLLGMAHKVKSSSANKALEVESLTRALADAKKAKLGKDVTDPIAARLKEALASALPSLPTEPGLAPLPMPIQSATGVTL